MEDYICFLYIKTCNHCGLKYFGKNKQKYTNKKEMYKNCHKYKGSGLIWKKHIKKYGYKNYSTKIIGVFYNLDNCENFALWFSKKENIVFNNNYANLCEENGKNGGDITNYIDKKLVYNKVSNSLKEYYKKNPEVIELKRQQNLGKKNGMYGRSHSKESIQKYTREVICLYCNKKGALNGMKRWHFDNCKNKK